MVDDMPGKERAAREGRATKEVQLEGFKARVGLEFERGAELVLLQGWRDDLEKLLTTGEDRAGMDTLCALYQAAKGATVAQPVAEPEPAAVVEPFSVAAALPVAIEPEPEPAWPAPAAEVPLTPAFAEAVKEKPVEPSAHAPIQKPAARRPARRSAADQLMFQF